ncbi:MAG TPA: type VII secretion-associated serine protease mycosin [Mycobacteriales bacterium]|nr:type VII secretion-associated serine protease mycosin [Mycobacteriales bacterium]
MLLRRRWAVTGATLVGLVATGAGQPGALAAAPLPMATLPMAALPVAALPAPAEPVPPEAACRYHYPEIQRVVLPRAAAPAQPWAQARLRYQEAWRYSTGRGVTVAVVDSGVDGGHPQLAGAVLPGADLTAGPVPKPGANTDCFGHGTQVAGIIAARPRGGVGFFGVAPRATILPIRQTWGVDGIRQYTQGSPYNLLRGIDLAVASGARVVNVSITLPAAQMTYYLKTLFRATIENAARHNTLVVTATGNLDENNNQSVATYPAALARDYDNVIAVGGLKADGSLDPNSITGDFVTVVAPDTDNLTSTWPHGSLIPSTGTSFAAPFVSGLAALLRSRFPGMSAAEVKRRIVLTADHPSTDLPSPQFGYGVINPTAALTMVLPPADAPTPAPPQAGPPLAPPPVPDTHTRIIALAIAGGGTLLALVVVAAAVIIPRGRRRRWQPGQRLDPASPDDHRADGPAEINNSAVAR